MKKVVRKWLRPITTLDGVRSYIQWEVTNDGGSVSMGDCGRSINYSHWAHGRTKRKDALAHVRMMDKLIDELRTYRDTYKEEHL